MNNKKRFIVSSFVAVIACVGIGLQSISTIPSSVVNSVSNASWRHYNRKAPTISEKGIKEYWSNCSDHSHQFVAPVSGTVLDMGSNYDTSEFAIDDNRWITYCDEHGHNLDQYYVCNICGQLDGELVSAKAIDGSTSSSDIDPAKGFNNVFYAGNINRGSEVGVNIDISTYDYIYYALYVVPQETMSYLCVYGGNPSTYATMNPGSWYYVLLYRNQYTNKLELYFRHTLNDSWESKVLDEADQTTTSFKKIRFYNWEGYLNYSVFCSEVYAIDIDTYCEHTFDEHNVCTKCMKHKDASQVYDYSVSNSSPSDDISAPTGFHNVYSATGKSNGYNGVDLNITQYNVIYLALYGTDYLLPYSGGQNDNTHKVLPGRWYYLLLERVDGSWTGYIRDSADGSWVSRTVDGPNDQNLKSLLRLYNWDGGLESVTIYNTEVYADDTPIVPVENVSSLNIGVWNGSYHFTNTSSIDDLVSAGINLVVGVNPLWNNNWNNVLNYALSKGVKFIVDPRGWDYEHSCYADWDGTCPSYANHDAVLGFIMWDEPSAVKYSQIAQMKATFDEVMPKDKIFFVNLLSSAASLSILYESEKVPCSYSYYETNYAQAYQNTVEPDLYSYDSYPLFTNGEIRKSYFASLDIWSNLSRNTGVPTWYTFLSSSHLSGDGDGYTYVLPSKKQLEWQMSVALSFGITNLMHYVYATNEASYSCMANVDGSTNEYFATVSEADANMHYLGSEISNYGWEGATTYHNNAKVNLLFKELQHTLSNSQVSISNISATSDLLIGSYVKEGKHAYLVTNSGISTDYSSTWSSKYRDYNANVAYTNQANTISLTLNSNFSGAYVIKDGEKTYVAASNNTISISLDAYGSAFVIPVI